MTPLKESGITVKTLDRFNSLQDIFHNYFSIGKAIGSEKIAQELVQAIKNKIESYPKSSTEKKLVICFADGTCLGKGTVTHDVAEICGAKNILARQGMEGWQKISLEKLALLKPEWLITSGRRNKKEEELKKLKKTQYLKIFLQCRKGKLFFFLKKNSVLNLHSLLRL